jgi:cholesterol transport system auxiliary component
MRVFLSVLLVLLSGACAVKAKQPAVHDFGLPTLTQLGATENIHINAPEWLRDDRIRYRLMYSAPTEVKFYSLDRWVASPPELLEQQWLVSDKKRGLVIQLLAFEQQFDTPDRARVVMEFKVDVYRADNKTLLATQGFHFERSSSSPDAAGAVLGLSGLTQQAAKKVQEWVQHLP